MRGKTFKLLAALTVGMLVLTSCGRNMFDQARTDAFEASPFFADGSAMRPIPEGTVSRERGALEPSYLTGLGPTGFLAELPIELNTDVLLRGQERYDIYCAPCHNYNGNGAGMIVQRGFPQPVSFTAEQRLLDSPVGYFYNAITNGFGRMYSYAARIKPEDRWAIAAYIKALQLSQNAQITDVPADILSQLSSTEAAR
ncbi:MAG: cytochrome c [Trueperaceae bacterium]